MLKIHSWTGHDVGVALQKLCLCTTIRVGRKSGGVHDCKVLWFGQSLEDEGLSGESGLSELGS